jgi:putative oligomerization/nucleic acid binding protein
VAVSAVLILVEAIAPLGGQWWNQLLGFLSLFLPYYVLVLIGSLVGVWYGRRHHEKFLAKKLARMERKAAKEAARQQASVAPANLPPPPHGVDARDPYTAIEKLAKLRDAGALTEDEFQAKKKELLGRI